MNFLPLLATFCILSVCFSCKKKEVVLDPTLYTNISDVNFEKKLIELGIDDKQDGLLLKSNAEKVTKLNISGVENKWGTIQSLDGIQAFVNLKSLNCSMNEILDLDVTKNTNLTNLKCDGNPKLKNLNIQTNISLDTLDAEGVMTNFDCSSNINLKYLSMRGYKLSTIDVSNNTKLGTLYIYSMPLKSIDISKNVNLKAFGIFQTQITEINISKNINLEKLFCSNNQLISLDVSKNITLKQLECTNNKIQIICVNSLNQPNASWYKDPTATYKVCN